jgi:hypothetical protein
VSRPQTFVDVIAALTGQNTGTADTSISGVGQFAEADESVAVADTWTSTVQANPTWDNGSWGQFTWG